QARAFARSEPARVHALALPDQDLGSVLVVPRRKGAGNAVGKDESEPEPVPLGAVLLGIALQVCPQLRRERVLVLDLLAGIIEKTVAVPGEKRLSAVRAVKDVLHGPDTLCRQEDLVPVKTDAILFPESDDE